MQQQLDTEALVHIKKVHNQIAELFSLTEQLAEAIDRDDQVTMRMLISMRDEPLYKIQELEAIFNDRLGEWPHEDATAARKILQGGMPEGQQEQELADALALNRRMLVKLVELDRRISQKLGGEKSFYATQEQKDETPVSL